MVHGGHGNRRVAGGKPTGSSNRSKGPAGGVSKKPKTVSLKNQIRSIERILRKDLPLDVRETQEKKLEGLKKQQETHTRLAEERENFLRDRKIKFFERRKIERRIRPLEKMHHSSLDPAQEAEVAAQLSKLKEDLEYVRFFPKTEKYVSLYSGKEDADIVDRRNRLRKLIKANLIAAAASGKDLEETGGEDDGQFNLSDDDFFAAGSSSDEGDADAELTTDKKSTRENASSASVKVNSSAFVRAHMLPPRPSTTHALPSSHNQGSTIGSSSQKKHFLSKPNLSSSNNASKKPFLSKPNLSSSNSASKKPFLSRPNLSSSNNASNIRNMSSNDRGFTKSRTDQNSNVSSSSDAHKPRRKRRPKKKNKQA